jgi:hypothetical protein
MDEAEGEEKKGEAMNLFHIRTILTADHTEGVLLIGDKIFALLLEDPVRTMLQASDKVAGKTAIPAGTYQIVVERSAKFGKDMAEIKGVEYFSETKYHCGSDVDDSLGCPLMGTVRPALGKMYGGVQAKLTEKLVEILKAAKGLHFVQIVEPFSLKVG